MTLNRSLLVLFLGVWVSAEATASDVIFYDDFQDGEAQEWSAGKGGSVGMNDYQGNYTLRLSGGGYAVARIDVTGWSRIQAGAAFAAADLEGKDRCLAQVSVDSGKSWITVARVLDGDDDSVTMRGGGKTVDLPDNVETLLFLARSAVDGDDDTCWLDNAYVLGVGGVANTIATREALTPRALLRKTPVASTIPMSEFRMPEGAAEPDVDFSGHFRLSGAKGGMAVVLDAWNRTGRVGDAISELPDFHIELVQNGYDLIPLDQEIQRTSHPYWETVVMPGKAWKEKGDGKWNRASLPFALQERSANCTHNGVMSWLFDDKGAVSNVAYQVTAETCGYLKLDLWGSFEATHEAMDFGGRAASAIKALQSLRENRLPVASLDDLARRYPGVNALGLGIEDGISPRDMSVYGMIVDGVHYRSECFTRSGPHPYCESFALSSYSTAKSIFAGVALMRSEALKPGIAKRPISEVISECDGSQWTDVSIESALDMATGNYSSRVSSEDEDSPPHVRFIFDDNHASKIDFACNHFKRRSEPDTQFVYHTSDTYLVGTALTNVWKEEGKDLYSDIVAGQLWQPLGLSPLMNHTKRTYDDREQAFAGYGLTFTPDDIARVAHWLNSEGGKIDGEAMLDAAMLSGTLQQSGDDPGLPAGSPLLRYNNGFWAYDAGPSLGCSEPAWVPFMSGVSGISVAMFPNDVIYYYFSDSYIFRWQSGREAAHTIKSLCQ